MMGTIASYFNAGILWRHRLACDYKLSSPAPHLPPLRLTCSNVYSLIASLYLYFIWQILPPKSWVSCLRKSRRRWREMTNGSTWGLWMGGTPTFFRSFAWRFEVQHCQGVSQAPLQTLVTQWLARTATWRRAVALRLQTLIQANRLIE